MAALVAVAMVAHGRSASAQTPAEVEAPEAIPVAAPLAAALAAFADRSGCADVGLAAGLGERLLHTSVRGDLTADTPMPIASASKWLAVATVLAVVDDGTLELDSPVARYLEEFDTPDRRTITLRQCLSCTAGMPATPPLFAGGIRELSAMVVALANAPLKTDPGLEFEYGGSGFQTAACCAVRRTGKDWHALFAAHIARPLGLTATAFGRLSPLASEPGTAAVPWVAGGAVSTLRDYERFVRMLACGGEFEGVRVLRRESVDAMFRSHTPGMTVRVPSRAGSLEGDLAYGLGTWLQQLGNGVLRGCDPGAFGFTPWVDRDRGVYGVLAVKAQARHVLPDIGPLQAEVRAFTQSPAVAGKDEFVQLEHGGRTRRFLLHTPPQAEKALALPLLVVLHGGGGNGEQVARSTGFSALADRENFVVVYPDGTGALRHKLLTWNSGGIAVYAAENAVDDVGFVKAVVAKAKTLVAIDPQRICATGMSNGGMMCHRLAREAADVFAAIAPVAGAMNFTAVDSAAPIDVMIVHGTADELVRYDGGRPDRRIGRSGDRVDASVGDAVKYYRKRNDLAGDAVVSTAGRLRTEDWAREVDGRSRRLRVVTVDGGGHEWPTIGDWSATTAVWAFCKDARKSRE